MFNNIDTNLCIAVTLLFALYTVFITVVAIVLRFQLKEARESVWITADKLQKLNEKNIK